jgi:hypothetical protein
MLASRDRQEQALIRLIRQQSILVPMCEQGLPESKCPPSSEAVVIVTCGTLIHSCGPYDVATALAGIPVARLQCMLDEVRVLLESSPQESAMQPSVVRPQFTLFGRAFWVRCHTANGVCDSRGI